jgi:predicted oxidoreductase
MQTVQLSEQVSFSRIVHGMWRLREWGMDKQELLRLIEECLEMGITTFDHADIYGDYSCEALFGQALREKPDLRSSMQIVTKCGIMLRSAAYPEHLVNHYDTSKEHIIRSVENSLRHFGTDYVDTLLIHRPDPFMDPAEVAEAFAQLKQEGKVLEFGVSNFLPSQMEMLASYLSMPLVTNQLEISVMQFEHFEKGTIEKCQEKRIAPMAWSPLAGGSIFSASTERATRVKNTLEEIKEEIGADSIDEIMYAWLLAHPAKMMPIVGSGKIERVRTAAQAVKLTLSRQQWFRIYISSLGHNVP